jgi:hypothetical protein
LAETSQAAKTDFRGKNQEQRKSQTPDMILTPSFSASDQNKKAVTSQRPIIYTSLSRRPEPELRFLKKRKRKFAGKWRQMNMTGRGQITPSMKKPKYEPRLTSHRNREHQINKNIWLNGKLLHF